LPWIIANSANETNSSFGSFKMLDQIDHLHGKPQVLFEGISEGSLSFRSGAKFRLSLTVDVDKFLLLMIYLETISIKSLLGKIHPGNMNRSSTFLTTHIIWFITLGGIAITLCRF